MSTDDLVTIIGKQAITIAMLEAQLASVKVEVERQSVSDETKAVLFKEMV